MKKHLIITLIFISLLIFLSIILYQTLKKPEVELIEPIPQEPTSLMETESDTLPKVEIIDSTEIVPKAEAEIVDTAEIVTAKVTAPPSDKPIIPIEPEIESIPEDDTLALLDLDLIPVPPPPTKPVEEKPVTLMTDVTLCFPSVRLHGDTCVCRGF